LYAQLRRPPFHASALEAIINDRYLRMLRPRPLVIAADLDRQCAAEACYEAFIVSNLF